MQKLMQGKNGYHDLLHSCAQSAAEYSKMVTEFSEQWNKINGFNLGSFFKISAYSWTIDLHCAERTLNKTKETFNGRCYGHTFRISCNIYSELLKHSLSPY